MNKKQIIKRNEWVYSEKKGINRNFQQQKRIGLYKDEYMKEWSQEKENAMLQTKDPVINNLKINKNEWSIKGQP